MLTLLKKVFFYRTCLNHYQFLIVYCVLNQKPNNPQKTDALPSFGPLRSVNDTKEAKNSL